MLWNSYGKDKISTDGRWHLQHCHIAGVGTWWVIYENTPGGKVYRGQKDTLKETKEYVGGLHTRPKT